MDLKAGLREIKHFNQSAIILKYVLKNYFETNSSHSVLTMFPGENRYFDNIQTVFLREGCSNTYIIRYFSTITSSHLFLEHKLIEILSAVNTLLTKGEIDKEADFISALTRNQSAIKLGTKNVKYYVLIKRFCNLVSKHSELPTELQIPVEYHFIAKSRTVLKQLASFRNDILHSGARYLNLYYYEFLFVNQLLPLFVNFINVNPGIYINSWVVRDVACGLDILNEIIKQPLPKKYDDQKKYEGLLKNLRRIDHLKELGRASYENSLVLPHPERPDEHQQAIENTTNSAIRNEAEVYSNFNLQNLGHVRCYKCPCCGTSSLTICMSLPPFQEVKAECHQCTYMIKRFAGEPCEFGIMSEQIFKA